MHYNIGKKIEINPFENIKYVVISNGTCTLDRFIKFLDTNSESVETKKLNGSWKIMYNIGVLDYTTILTWYTPDRGKFYFQDRSIHFSLSEDTMSCW